MGDRGQVFFPETGTYLYTHYGAHNLRETVRQALIRGTDRWTDPEYLARIVFCEMIRDEDIDSTLSFGIGTSRHGDAYRVVELDTRKQIVTVRHWSYEPGAKEYTDGKDYSEIECQHPFEDFIHRKSATPQQRVKYKKAGKKYE